MNKERSADRLMAAAAAAMTSNNNHSNSAKAAAAHHHRRGSGGGSLQLKQRAARHAAETNYCMSDVMARYGPKQQQQQQQQQAPAGLAMSHSHGHSHSRSHIRSNNSPIARPFPIVSFNHMSREVLDYEMSRDFYCGVLGFIEIPRPAFENDGVWLYGFGLSLHLIKSKYPQKRLLLKGRRIEHFEEALPNVDHMAFITSNLNEVERQLREHNVFYKRFNSDKMGIYQIFLFDPDGNVIEISNCAPPVGEVACMPRVKGAGSRKGEPHARL